MFGATKAFAAIGILAVSAIFLVQVVTDPPANDPPVGAEGFAAGLDPAIVSGTIAGAEWPEVEEQSLGNDMYEWTSPPATAMLQSDDDRLTGSASFIEHGLQHFKTYTGLRASEWTIVNDGGTWTGTGDAYSSATGGRDFLVLTGSGGYDGLSAYIAIGPGTTVDDDAELRAFEGVIFPEPPPSDPTP